MANKKKFLAELEASRRKVVDFLKEELAVAEALENRALANEGFDQNDMAGRHVAIIKDCLWKTKGDLGQQ